MTTSALFGFVLYGGVFSLLLNLYLVRLGYDPRFLGLVNATGALSFAALSVPAGILGRVWGSRLCMIYGVCTSVVGYSLLSQSELVPLAYQRGYILATSSFSHFGVSLWMVNGPPYLMSVSKLNDRNQVFAIQAAIVPLAGFAGSLFGGFLPGQIAKIFNLTPENPIPYRYTLFIASLFLIPAIIALLFTQKEDSYKNRMTSVGTNTIPTGIITIVAFISLLHLAGESALRTFFNVYLDNRLKVPTSLIGVQMAFGQILAVPASLAMPIISNRIGKRNTLVISGTCAAIILFPLALVPNWIVAGLCFMSFVAINSIRRITYVIFYQEMMPEKLRSLISGAVSMASGIGYSSMALGAGYIIITWGYPFLFLTGSLFTLIGTSIFCIYFRGPYKQDEYNG